MTSSSYDVSQFLLDRANIQDTATLMYQLFDQKKFPDLSTLVFAPELKLDYTALFGGSPETKPREALIAQWQGLQSRIADSAHTITGVTTDLPQPGNGVPVPTKANAVGNGAVLIRGVKESVVENKGRMYLEFTKFSDLDGNPWRISGIRAELVWMKGTFDSLGQDFEEKQKEEKAKTGGGASL